MKLPDVLPLRPYLREMVWGGRRLQELYGKALPEGKNIGESFEVSAYPGRESAVREGPLEGWPLSRVVAAFGEELTGGQGGGEFPLLVKLLDAQEDLSIQVHPGDVYARAQNLGRWGKEEVWFVLHSEGGRIAHGLREGVGRKELAEAIGAGRVEEVVQFFAVRPGDLIVSPPGTVHTLCRGVVVYEVQQSSDLTFRLYDYNRPGLDGKPRELHVAQALEVIDFETRLPAPVPWQRLGGEALVEGAHFSLRHCGPLRARAAHPAGSSCQALTLVAGAARVRGREEEGELRAGETALVPAGREFAMVPAPQCEYLIAAPTGDP